MTITIKIWHVKQHIFFVVSVCFCFFYLQLSKSFTDLSPLSRWQCHILTQDWCHHHCSEISESPCILITAEVPKEPGHVQRCFADTCPMPSQPGALCSWQSSFSSLQLSSERFIYFFYHLEVDKQHCVSLRTLSLTINHLSPNLYPHPPTWGDTRLWRPLNHKFHFLLSGYTRLCHFLPKFDTKMLWSRSRILDSHAMRKCQITLLLPRFSWCDLTWRQINQTEFLKRKKDSWLSWKTLRMEIKACL